MPMMGISGKKNKAFKTEKNKNKDFLSFVNELKGNGLKDLNGAGAPPKEDIIEQLQKEHDVKRKECNDLTQLLGQTEDKESKLQLMSELIRKQKNLARLQGELYDLKNPL